MPVVDLTIDSRGAVAGLNKYDKAVSNSATKTDSAFSKMRSGAGTVATAVGVTMVAGVAAATAAVVAFTSALSAAGARAREIENLSRLAGTGVEAFQNLAAASEQYGISGEKLADISKDVQDKLGDFIATGAGEFADFFENVAPKVGLTADALARMSGPDALIAVKKAMDDANVSAAEQVFYLESLGNDLSLLAPLLENNGALWQANATAFKEMGVALNAWDIARLKEGQAAVAEVSKTLLALKDKVLAKLVPAFTMFIDLIKKQFKATGLTVDEFATKIAVNIVKAFGYAAEAVRFFHNGVLGLELAANAVVVAFSFMTNTVIQLLSKLMTPLSLIIDALVHIGAVENNPFDSLKQAGEDFYQSSLEGFTAVTEKIESTNSQYDKLKFVIEEVVTATKEGAEEQKKASEELGDAIKDKVIPPEKDLKDAVDKVTTAAKESTTALKGQATAAKEVAAAAEEISARDQAFKDEAQARADGTNVTRKTHEMGSSPAVSTAEAAYIRANTSVSRYTGADGIHRGQLSSFVTSGDRERAATNQNLQLSSRAGATADVLSAREGGVASNNITNIFNSTISRSDVTNIMEESTRSLARS